MNGFNIISLDTLPSTNDYFKQALKKGEVDEGTVVITQNQPNGRGQGSNTWESEANKNLTFSLLLKPSFVEAGDMFIISKVISLGIIEYLATLGNEFTIKWPNDIYWKDKKLGGILIENQLLGCCLNYSTIGIGLNINQVKFISNAPNPISLKQIFGNTYELNTCLNQILKCISIWYTKLGDKKFDLINETYFDKLFRKDTFYKYKVENVVITAKIESVNNDGLLNLRTIEGALKSFYFKEVEFIL